MDLLMISDKIKSISDLALIAAEGRKCNQKVVLAHGVFDVLHIGHKRHFDVGRRAGGLLMVTVTCDKYVNKGPERPIFPENLRAEMLAALDCVDYVAISEFPSAEPIIEVIRPDIYLKGSEYSAEQNDVTGRISVERAQVEEHGGYVLYTEEETFSSSNIANRSIDRYPEEASIFLQNTRTRISAAEISDEIGRAKKLRCLIIGDAIMDEYIYVEPLGKPSKENILSTRYKHSELFSGGVLATSKMLGEFSPLLDLVTVLGAEDSFEKIIRDGLGANVNFIPFFRDTGGTTRKTRLVDPGYYRKLFEIAYLQDEPLAQKTQAEMNGWILDNIDRYDAVFVNDFGHGMIDEALINILCQRARFLALNVQTNSANRGFNLITKYPRADLICIDEPEARLAAMDRISPIDILVQDKLFDLVDCKAFVVTHGKLGCLVAIKGEEIQKLPALTHRVVDTIGAGDAFFAAAAPLFAVGCDPFIAAFVGNAVGAMKVNVVGHSKSTTLAEVLKYIQSLLK